MRNSGYIRGKSLQKRYGASMMWASFFVACGGLMITLGWCIGEQLAWTSDQVVSTGSYIESLPDTLASFQKRRFLRIISLNNKVFFPDSVIERELLHKYPRLASVDIIPSWESITYVFTEREPVLIVCTTTSPVFPTVESVFSDTLIDECWYVDEGGIVFDIAPRLSSGVYPILIIPEAPSHLPLRILESSTTVASLQRFVEELRQLSIITEVIVYNNQDMRIISTELFSSLLGKPGSIIFDTHEVLDTPDHQKLIERIHTATTRGPFAQHVQEDGIMGFKYLDMRFPDKFFYKFSPVISE